jgi:hypothetical protein
MVGPADSSRSVEYDPTATFADPPLSSRVGRNASMSCRYPVRSDPWSEMPKLTAD